MRDYYASFAKGGFGMIVSEGVYTDTAYSQGYFNQPGLATDAHRDSWKPIVQAVHEAGAAFIAQLMHGGAQTQGNIHHARHVAPSAVQPSGSQLKFYGGEGPYATPAEMSEEDIRRPSPVSRWRPGTRGRPASMESSCMAPTATCCTNS